MPLEALNHVRDIGTGDTRPQVFLCDNDGALELWVLKLAGLSAGELAADWIGSRLAHRLGLRCPPVAVAHVSANALGTAPDNVRAWARTGPAFASKLLDDIDAGLTDADLLSVDAGDLGMMYALDAWLEVLDRRKPDGIWNALVSLIDGGLIVLDYGKSLSPCLHVVLSGGDVLIAPDYPAAVRQVADVNAALRTCATIESLSSAEIEQVVGSVPADWLSYATRPRVVRFLMERAGQIRDLCLRSVGGSER